MGKMTQMDRVIQHMNDFGSISSLEAFRELGVTRLSDVIFKMKKAGVVVYTKLEKSSNRYGDPVFYARYSFKEFANDNEV